MNEIKTYKQWKSDSDLVITDNTSYSKYLEYVNTQYSIIQEDISNIQNYSEDYKTFISKIKTLLLNEEYDNILKYVDVDKDDDLRASIPYIAAYLSNIAQTLAKERINPSNTTKRYEDIDSSYGLESKIYNAVLMKYAKDNSISFSEIPDVIKNGLSIDIAEYVDSFNYFDKDPRVEISEYYSVSDNLTDYLSIDPNMTESLLSWALSSGINDVELLEVADPTNNVEIIDYGVTNVNISEYKNQMVAKYLAETQYILDTGEVNTTISAPLDYKNGLNRYFPTIAMLPVFESLQEKDVQNIDDFLINLGIPVYHGKNRAFEITPVDADKDYFIDPVRYSNGRSLTKASQKRPVAYNPTYNWIDYDFNINITTSIIAKTDAYQEMIPYKSAYEINRSEEVGINKLTRNTDPWNGALDNEWIDEVGFPPDFRKIYDIAGWNDQNVLDISGYEYSLGIDLYGNNYALYKDVNYNNLYNFNAAGGRIYITSIDGAIIPLSVIVATQFGTSGAVLGSVDLNNIMDMQVYNNTIIIVDIYENCIVFEVEVSDSGIPNVNLNKFYDFYYDFNGSVSNYKYFNHIYNDDSECVSIIMSKVVDTKLTLILFYWDGVCLKQKTTYENTDTSGILSISQNTLDYNTNLKEFVFVTRIKRVDYSYAILIQFYSDITGWKDGCILIPINTLSGTTATTENKNILDVKYINEEKLLFVIEGSETSNKYLQILEL